MENFKSICIVHNREDTYKAFYLKEYFKWIGLSYVAVVNKPERNIFENEEYYQFDVIVNYNEAIDQEQCIKIEGKTEDTLITVSDNGKSVATLLVFLLSEIGKRKFKNSLNFQALLSDLAVVYTKEHMVDLLYEYTFILLPRLPEAISERLFERIDEIVDQVKVLVRNQMNQNKESGVEYALYALFYSMKMMNEFQSIKGRPLIYDTEEYLEEVNKIYTFDEKFFKVETLKAKVAEFDNRFSAIPRIFLENAILDCPISICKSYHYYMLGKWKERNRQVFEASVAYQKSYFADKTNIKAIFKLAVEQKRLDDNRMAESYFKLIIEELELLFVDKEEMSLREIEYLYKSYLLVADSCEKQFQSQYLNKAEECLRYIDSIIENPTRMDFTLQLYQSVEVKIAIALAMKERLRSSMWNCIQNEMREEDNEKAEG